MENDEYKITRQMVVKVNAEAVWNALTDPKITKKYMFNCEVSSDWTVGSEIRWKGNYQGYESGERGEILEIEKNIRLKYTSIDPNFGIEITPENHLHITYVLLEESGCTTLTTSIESFNNDPKRMIHITAGWDNIVLPALKEAIISL